MVVDKGIQALNRMSIKQLLQYYSN